jgi:hypothetical protein
MSIDTVTTQLATIQAAITGITKAYAFDETPNSLTPAVLPCFTNIPGTAEFAVPPGTPWGDGVAAETRRYEMWLWICPASSPVDVKRQASAVQGHIENVKAAFYGRPQLEGLQGVFRARLVSDTGPAVQEYGGTEYVCVGFVEEITFLEQVTYATGD